jgi:REP element-mobilizing transposase RayT
VPETCISSLAVVIGDSRFSLRRIVATCFCACWNVRERYQFVVVGYVIMPVHVHLLISEPQESNPSIVMQALKLGFARRILVKAKRRSHPAQAALFEHAPAHLAEAVL